MTKYIIWTLACAAMGGCDLAQQKAFHPATMASRTEQGRMLVIPQISDDERMMKGYSYIMPEEQQRRVLREAPLLRVGDSAEKVAERLGPPYYDGLSAPANLFDRLKREMVYYFAKRDELGACVDEPSIQIFFDDHYRVECFVSNVPGIPSLNWPFNWPFGECRFGYHPRP